MNEEEKNAIEYLKTRLYGNEGCKYIDVAQEDLRIFINLIDSLQKENEELKSKLENKDKYFELIIGLGYDYDGYYNRETSSGNMKGLADLIDELVQAARDGSNDIPYQK